MTLRQNRRQHSKRFGTGFWGKNMTRDEILKLMIAGTLVRKLENTDTVEDTEDFIARQVNGVLYRFTSNIDINKITRQEFEHICL